MADGNNIGNLYYTVSIDRASLSKVKEEFKKLGASAEQASGGTKKMADELKRLKQASGVYEDEAEGLNQRVTENIAILASLASELKDVTNMYEKGRVEAKAYVDESMGISTSAEAVRISLLSLAEQASEVGVDLNMLQKGLEMSSGIMLDVRTNTEQLGQSFSDSDVKISAVTTVLKTLSADFKTLRANMETMEPEDVFIELMRLESAAESLDEPLKGLSETMGQTEVGAEKVAQAYAMLAQQKKNIRDQTERMNASVSDGKATLDKASESTADLAAKTKQLIADEKSRRISQEQLVAGLTEVAAKSSEVRAKFDSVSASTEEFGGKAKSLRDGLTKISEVEAKVATELQKIAIAQEKASGAINEGEARFKELRLELDLIISEQGDLINLFNAGAMNARELAEGLAGTSSRASKLRVELGDLATSGLKFNNSQKLINQSLKDASGVMASAESAAEKYSQANMQLADSVSAIKSLGNQVDALKFSMDEMTPDEVFAELARLEAAAKDLEAPLEEVAAVMGQTGAGAEKVSEAYKRLAQQKRAIRKEAEMLYDSTSEVQQIFLATKESSGAFRREIDTLASKYESGKINADQYANALFEIASRAEEARSDFDLVAASTDEFKGKTKGLRDGLYEVAKAEELVSKGLRRIALDQEKAAASTDKAEVEYKRIRAELNRLKQEQLDLINLRKAGRKTDEQLTKGMARISAQAEALRVDTEELATSTGEFQNHQQLLNQALRDTSSLMASATSATEKYGGTVDKVSKDFRDLTSEINTIKEKIRTLFSRRGEEGFTEEMFEQGLKALQVELQQAEQRLESFETAMSGSAQSIERFTRVQGVAASASKKINDGLKSVVVEAAKAQGQFQVLDDAFFQAAQDARMLADQIKATVAQLDRGEGDTRALTNELQAQKSMLELVSRNMRSYGNAVNITGEEQSILARRVRESEQVLRTASNAATKHAGTLSRQAMAANLSYGGLTLLQDRIFQISPALGIFTNQLMFTEKGLKAMLASMLPVLAVAGSIIAVFGTLAASMRAGSNLESALADVQKTTNLTSSELRQLTESFQSLSKEIPSGVNELLEMAKVAGQLGITGVENIEEFSTAIAKLSIATNVAGEEGAESLARFLQALGTETENMGSAANRTANILNELENTTASTAKEILNMTSYTQGLASQSGFTDAQILALNSSLLSLGVQAEAGGSALVRTLDGIQTASARGGDELFSMARIAGMTVGAFKELTDASPIDAFMALVAGMRDASESGENLSVVLADLGITEVRERRALLALSQGYDVLSSSMQTASEQGILLNSLNREVEIMTGKVESKVKMLGARFVEIGQDIGTALLPAMSSILDMLIALVDNIDILIGVLAGLGTAILAFSGPKIAGLLVTSLKSIKTAITGVFTVVTSLNPVLRIAVVALSAAAGAFAALSMRANSTEKAIDDVKDSLDDFESTSDSHESDIDALSRAYNSLDDSMGRQGVLGVVSELAGELEGPALDALSEYYNTTLTAKLAQDDFAGAVDDTREAIEEMTRSQLLARELTLTTQIAEARQQLEALQVEISGVSRGGLPGLFGADYNMQELLNQYLGLRTFLDILPPDEIQRLEGMSEQELMQFFGTSRGIDLEQLREADAFGNADDFIKLIEEYQENYASAFPLIVGLLDTIENLEAQLLEVQGLQDNVTELLTDGQPPSDEVDLTFINQLTDAFAYIDSATGTFEDEAARTQAKIDVLTRLIEDIERDIADAGGVATEAQLNALRQFIPARDALRKLLKTFEDNTGETAVTAESILASARTNIESEILLLKASEITAEELSESVSSSISSAISRIAEMSQREGWGLGADDLIAFRAALEEQFGQYLIALDDEATSFENAVADYEQRVAEIDLRGELMPKYDESLEELEDTLGAQTRLRDTLIAIAANPEIEDSVREQARDYLTNGLLDAIIATQNSIDSQELSFDAFTFTPEETARRANAARATGDEASRQAALSSARTRRVQDLARLRKELSLGNITQEEFEQSQISVYETVIESGFAYRMSTEELQYYMDTLESLKQVVDDRNTQMAKANELTDEEIAIAQAATNAAEARANREEALSTATTTYAEELSFLKRQFEQGRISQSEYEQGQLQLLGNLIETGIRYRMSAETLDGYIAKEKELKQTIDDRNAQTAKANELTEEEIARRQNSAAMAATEEERQNALSNARTTYAEELAFLKRQLNEGRITQDEYNQSQLSLLDNLIQTGIRYRMSAEELSGYLAEEKNLKQVIDDRNAQLERANQLSAEEIAIAQASANAAEARANREEALSNATTTYAEELNFLRKQFKQGRISQSEYEQGQLELLGNLIEIGIRYGMSAEALDGYLRKEKELKQTIDDRNEQTAKANELTDEEIARRQSSAATAATEEERQKALSNARTTYAEELAFLKRQLDQGRITQDEYNQSQLSFLDNLIQTGIRYRMSAEELDGYIAKEKDLKQVIDDRNAQRAKANELTAEEIARRQSAAAMAATEEERQNQLSAARTRHAEGISLVQRRLDAGLITQREALEEEASLHSALIETGVAYRMSSEELDYYRAKLDETNGSLRENITEMAKANELTDEEIARRQTAAAATAAVEERQKGLSSARTAYAEDLNLLKRRLSEGRISQSEYNQEQLRLLDALIETGIRYRMSAEELDGYLAKEKELKQTIDDRNAQLERANQLSAEEIAIAQASTNAAEARANREQALSSATTTYAEGLNFLRKQLNQGRISQSEYDQGQLELLENIIQIGIRYDMSAETLDRYIAKEKELKQTIDDRNAQLEESSQLTAEEIAIANASAGAAEARASREKALSSATTTYAEELSFLRRQLDQGRISQSQYDQAQLELLGNLIEAGIRYRMSAEALDAYIAKEKELKATIDDRNAQLEKANQLSAEEVAIINASAGAAEARRQRDEDASRAKNALWKGLYTINRELRLGLITQEEYNEEQIKLYESFLDSAIAARMTDEELQVYLDTLNRLREEQAEANKETISFGEAMLDVASSLRGIAGDFGSAAKDIFDAFETMTDGLEELEGDAKKEQISTGIASIVNSVSSLMPQYESAANQFVEATLTMAGAAIGFGVAGAQGAQAGAAIGGFLSSLFGDLSSGLEEIKEQIDETASSANYLSRGIIENIANESTKTVSSGGIYGGTKKAIDQQAYDAAVQAAGSIAAGLASALKSGIQSAISGEQDWKATLRTSLRESMMEQVINAFVETTLKGGAFDGFIKNFTELLQNGDLSAAIDYLNERFKGVTRKMKKDTQEFIDGVGEAFEEPLKDAIKRVYKSAAESTELLSDRIVKKIVKKAVEDGQLNEAMADEMLNIANSVASGFSSGLTQGINDALSGNPEWKKNLRESLRSTIMDSVINTFIQTAILDGLFGNFFATISEKLQAGEYESSLKYASENIGELSDLAAELIQEFVSSVDDELRPEDQVDGISRGSGAAISEITGPTRDLFLDLFRPLSILPSWTTMIRDIRNDVRSIASMGGFVNPPSVSLNQMSAASAPSVQNIIINNPIINTQAANAKELYRDISRQANKQKRGGK